MATNPVTVDQQVPKVLYHIVKGKGRNNHWRKFGAGFVNRDGSVNIIIDLFPGQHFQLRPANQQDIEEEVTARVEETKSKGGSKKRK